MEALGFFTVSDAVHCSEAAFLLIIAMGIA